MAFYRMSGSSKGELHGASILVTTEEETLTTVELYLGDTKVKDGVFKEGACLFTDLLEIGEYKAKSGEYESDTAEITASDILNKVTKSVSIATTTTINLILEGAKEDTITITNKNGATVGVCVFPTGSTVGEVEIDIVDGQPYTFTSSVAKGTTEETKDQDYSKTVTLTDETPTEPMTLVVGNTYKLGGYNWTCAEAIDGGYVLQSQGVTADTWNNLFNSATTDQDGVDCHSNNSVLNDLYGKIKSAEKSASYGSGLFLVSNAKCGTTTSTARGSGYYYDAVLKAARTVYAGLTSSFAWLGTSNGSTAWCVFSENQVFSNYPKTHVFVVAPAFNIDSTKAKLVGDEIVILNTVKVMPEGAVYWYGNECVDVTGGLKRLPDEGVRVLTQNTNSIKINANSTWGWTGIITNNLLNVISFEKLNCLIEGGWWILGTSSKTTFSSWLDYGDTRIDGKSPTDDKIWDLSVINCNLTTKNIPVALSWGGTGHSTGRGVDSVLHALWLD